MISSHRGAAVPLTTRQLRVVAGAKGGLQQAPRTGRPSDWLMATLAACATGLMAWKGDVDVWAMGFSGFGVAADGRQGPLVVWVLSK
jgi:hypothetical protein